MHARASTRKLTGLYGWQREEQAGREVPSQLEMQLHVQGRDIQWHHDQNTPLRARCKLPHGQMGLYPDFG